MKHIKKFNESSDNKLELLRDVFDNIEPDEYHYEDYLFWILSNS